jgi:methylated-DNA-[protein]-cysteine S-methyltransferase
VIDIYVKKLEGVWYGVAHDSEEIFATMFAFNEKSALRGLRESIPFNVPFQKVEKASVFADRVITLLKDIYDGKKVTGSPSLAKEHLSTYTWRVLQMTSSIPLGYVASYGSVSKAAGGSPRAVGRVMASNPFAPIVPCHRVVRSDFTLGGYGGGLDVKLEFLKRESQGYSSERDIPVDGKKLRVFPVELVLEKLRKHKC